MPEGSKKKKGKSSSKERPRGEPPPEYYEPPPGYYKQPPPEYKRVFRGEYGSYNRYHRNENDNMLAGCCYLIGWIVALVVLLAVKPLSPWLRFHAIQSIAFGVVFGGAIMVLFMITFMLMFVLIGFLCLPFLFLLIMCVWAYNLIIAIMCFTNKDHRIPIIADWVEKNFI